TRAEIFDELDRAEGAGERGREGWNGGRINARGQHAQAALHHARQVELRPQRVVAVRGRAVLARQIAFQPVLGEPWMRVQIGERRIAMDRLRIDGLDAFAEDEHVSAASRAPWSSSACPSPGRVRSW